MIGLGSDKKKRIQLTTGSFSNREFSTINSSRLSSNPMNVSFLISLQNNKTT